MQLGRWGYALTQTCRGDTTQAAFTGITELGLHSRGAAPAAVGVAVPGGVETPQAWGTVASCLEAASLQCIQQHHQCIWPLAL